MALLVSVLTTYVLSGHIEHNKIALRHERNLPGELADGKISAQVLDHQEAMEGDPLHSGGDHGSDVPAERVRYSFTGRIVST